MAMKYIVIKRWDDLEEMVIFNNTTNHSDMVRKIGSVGAIGEVVSTGFIFL